MFIQNKYYRWYLALTSKSDVDGYREEHHKIPKAMGGSNRRDNLVLLSARKHFLAHWLLTKCTSGKEWRSMQWAFACMSRNPSGERNLSAWRYARARSAYSHAASGRSSKLKGRKMSVESRIKMSAARKGKKLTDEHRSNIGRGLKGKTIGLRKGKPRPMSPEQRAAYSERMKGNRFRVGVSVSEETRAKLCEAAKGNTSKLGMKDSQQTRERKRAAQLARYARS